MNRKVSFLWDESENPGQFQTGVCLHGHTMYSEECLSFLPAYLRYVPGVAQIVDYYESPRCGVDFARAYWTPPLTPASALRLEQKQIEAQGLRPLVSLTDHDSIQAGMALQVTADSREVPLSVEWTVPYHRSILHLGIHNLPADSARDWMAAMSAYTAAPQEQKLPEMLRELSGIADVLIVLNHPFWLEEGVVEADHRRALDRVLRECLPWLHAFELNGTRRWAENAAVLDLAGSCSRPVISGGDRHASEPSACINLTDVQSFAEFVDEIRGGHSSVLFLPQYREPMPIRLLEATWDILKPYPEYPGRERWTDRIFYRDEAGYPRPLSVVWKGRIPWTIRPVTGLVQFSAAPSVRSVLRFLLSREAEALR